MGITPNTMSKLLNVIEGEHFTSVKMLEFGPQNLLGDFTDQRFYKFSYNGEALGQCNISDAVFARKYFENIGFEYKAIDYFSVDGCLELDLNYSDIPDEYIGKFNVVTNIGTSEHIFNQFNCFKNIHDATDVGGLMAHGVPMNNMIDHGFFNAQPNLFLSMAVANDYEIIEFGIGQSKKQMSGKRFETYVDIEVIDKYCKLDLTLDTGVWVVFKKTNSNPFKVPQQDIYEREDKRFHQSSGSNTGADKDNKIKNKLHELSLQIINPNNCMRLLGGKKVVLYGAGGAAKEILSIERLRKFVCAVTDIDTNKHGQKILGIPIVPPSEIGEYSNHVVVTIDIDFESVSNFIHRHSSRDISISMLDVGTF